MNKYVFLSLLLVALTTFDCASKKVAVAPAAPSYAGEWFVDIAATPLGDVQGVLRLDKDEAGNYSGKFVANGAEYNLRSATVGEEGLRAVFYFSDYGVDVEMALTGEATGPLDGVTNEEYVTTAQRR